MNSPSEAKKSFWKIIPVPLLILVVGFVAVIGLLTLKPAPKKMPPREPPAPQVNVVQAHPSMRALKVQSQGTVAPKREIDLVVQVSGKIEKVSDSFIEGGFFNEGDVLLQVEKRDYELALIRAKARVAEAEQALATERGRVRQAQREWRDLGNQEANDLFLRKPQLAAVEAQLAAAEADRDKAQLDLERTSLRAPFTGRVREANVDLGQYVTPGNRVGRVYDTSVAEIRLPLTDKQASLVDLPLGFRKEEKHADAKVVIEGIVGGESYQWQGEIVRTDASLDVNSRMYFAVAEVKDPFVEDPDVAKVPLVVGLFVNAEISGREIENVVEVPRRAVFKKDQIYTLDSENKLIQKTVQVLMTAQGNAWIKGNINAGERIVVGGQNFLVSGMEVAPIIPQEVTVEISRNETEQASKLKADTHQIDKKISEEKPKLSSSETVQSETTEESE